MEKKYYIKEFSETFGVSPATLRYYEKIGLLCSKRNEKNRYRYYTDDDYHKIMIIRILRSFGFSVNDIRNSQWIKSGERMTAALDREMRRIDAQIGALSLRKTQLAYYRRIAACIDERRFRLGREHLGKTFLFYGQMVRDDMVRPGDPNGITYDLYECMPLCMAGTLIEGISSNAMLQRYGLLIRREYLPRSIAEEQMDEAIEVQDCLHLIIPVTGMSVALSSASFETIREYAVSLGYPEAERALCTIIPSSQGETVSYLDCYILI